MPRASAREYLQSRRLDFKQIEVGYNGGQFHHARPAESGGTKKDEALIRSCIEVGLLQNTGSKSRTGDSAYTVFGKWCIVFALKDKNNHVAGLYFRSTLNDKSQRHFYLKDRAGLYPCYPKATTAKLILTESIIDAATLLQIPAIAEQHSVLALYGTNGFTQEHQQAVTTWAGTPAPQQEGAKEIILWLNADKPGEEATQKHAAMLQAMHPHINITCVRMPSGEDVNSLAQSHDDTNVFIHLLNERSPDFYLSTETAPSGPRTPLKNNYDSEQKENKSPGTEPAKPALPAGRLFTAQPVSVKQPESGHENTQRVTSPPSEPVPMSHRVAEGFLNTSNPELLVYNNCTLKIEVWGGIKITGLERMKVTLKVLHKEKQNLLPVRHSFDLYHRQQTEQLIQAVSDSFDMNIQQVEATVAQITHELENYRLQKLEAMQPKAETKPLMSEAARQTAIGELKRPNLLKRTNEMIGLTGIVGEESSRLIAYLAYTMRKQPVPLHVMFLGSSGSGKTYLQEKVSGLVPEEDKIEITQITENALY